MNNIFERIEIAESLGYISYGNCSDTPEQKTIAKWWNAENPSALVELPTLNELTIEKLLRELDDMTKQRDEMAEALKCIERHGVIMGSTGDYRQGQLDALKSVKVIASEALAPVKGGRKP